MLTKSTYIGIKIKKKQQQQKTKYQNKNNNKTTKQTTTTTTTLKIIKVCTRSSNHNKMVDKQLK